MHTLLSHNAMHKGKRRHCSQLFIEIQLSVVILKLQLMSDDAGVALLLATLV